MGIWYCYIKESGATMQAEWAFAEGFTRKHSTKTIIGAAEVGEDKL